MSFPTNQTQESSFHSAKWWSANGKYFCFLFITSRVLLQSHAEFNRLLWKNFLTCYSCLYYSSMIWVINTIYYTSSNHRFVQRNFAKFTGKQLCQGSSRMGEAKKSPLPKICHTYPAVIKLFLVIPYLRKTLKKYKSRDIPLEFCWYQHFFVINQQVLLYQEIQMQIAFWYIMSNYCNFSWVFKDFYNKHVYNFGDVNQDGYPRPS